MKREIAIILAVLALSGCAHKGFEPLPVKQVLVPVRPRLTADLRAPCPDLGPLKLGQDAKRLLDYTRGRYKICAGRYSRLQTLFNDTN